MEESQEQKKSEIPFKKDFNRLGKGLVYGVAALSGFNAHVDFPEKLDKFMEQHPGLQAFTNDIRKARKQQEEDPLNFPTNHSPYAVYTVLTTSAGTDVSGYVAGKGKFSSAIEIFPNVETAKPYSSRKFTKEG